MIIGPGEPRRPEKPRKDAKKAKAKKRRRAEHEAVEAAVPSGGSTTEEAPAAVEAPATVEGSSDPGTSPEQEAATDSGAATGAEPVVASGSADAPVRAEGRAATTEPLTPSSAAPLDGIATTPPLGVPLTDRIDGLRGRVDELLALVDAAAGTSDPTVAAAGLSPRPLEPAGASRPESDVGGEPWTPEVGDALHASVETADDLHGAPRIPDALHASVETADDQHGTARTPEAPRSPVGTATDHRPADVASSPPPSSAVLVARELLAAGMPTERVRVRLRDAYGVADPDAVLAGVGDR